MSNSHMKTYRPLPVALAGTLLRLGLQRRRRARQRHLRRNQRRPGDGALDVTLLFGSPSAFTLGRVAALPGSWSNDTAAVFTTNVPGSSYRFTATTDNHSNSVRYIPALNQWIKDAKVSLQIYNTNLDEMGASVLLSHGRAIFLSNGPAHLPGPPERRLTLAELMSRAGSGAAPGCTLSCSALKPIATARATPSRRQNVRGLCSQYPREDTTPHRRHRPTR
jgi:hypothetical protein